MYLNLSFVVVYLINSNRVYYLGLESKHLVFLALQAAVQAGSIVKLQLKLSPPHSRDVFIKVTTIMYSSYYYLHYK